MFIPIFFSLSLAFQDPTVVQNTDTFELAEKWNETQAKQDALQNQADKVYNLLLERRFEVKFNGVAHALEDFGKTWNRSHTIDPAKAKKIDKAWRELEKADAWFDPDADR